MLSVQIQPRDMIQEEAAWFTSTARQEYKWREFQAHRDCGVHANGRRKKGSKIGQNRPIIREKSEKTACALRKSSCHPLGHKSSFECRKPFVRQKPAVAATVNPGDKADKITHDVRTTGANATVLFVSEGAKLGFRDFVH